MTDPADKLTTGMIPYKSNDTEDPAVPSGISKNDAVTSYIFSTSNRSLSKYGERLLMQVIATAQEYAIDLALGQNRLNFSEVYSEKFAEVDIPIKSLLDADDTTNYTTAKKAAVELMKIFHTVEAPVKDRNGEAVTNDDGSPLYQFAAFHLLDKVFVNRTPGQISVQLGAQTWASIMDFSKGYRRYNILLARQLNNVVAIRLFQLISNSSSTLHFGIEKIKGILGMADKYKNNTSAFLLRVITPAEEEINEKCSFTITHSLTYEKSPGRPSISGITFIRTQKNTSQQNPQDVLGPELLALLVKTYGFNERGVRSNIKLFSRAIDSGVDLKSFLDDIAPKSKIANSPQGYIIRSLQNLLEKQGAAGGKTVIQEPKRKPRPAAVQKTAPPAKKERLTVENDKEFKGSGLEEL